MSRPEPGSDGIRLSHVEALCLARRVAARQLHSTDEWLEWEDYPNLDQQSFEELDLAVRDIGLRLSREAREADYQLDVDSADLLSRAEA